MANETSGTPTQDDRDAQETATTGTPASDGADASAPEQETAEEKIARLEAFREKALAEKTENEKRAKRLEEAERLLAEREERDRASTPPTAQNANPLDQLIQNLAEQARQYPNDATVQFALQGALEKRQRDRQDAIIRAAEPEFQKMPDAYRDRARNAWLQGRAATPSDALMMVKGEAVGDIDLVAERKRQEADRAAKDRLASTPATTAGASIPSREHTKKLAMSEYQRRLDAGDVKLMDDVDSGRVELDYNR